VLYVLPVWMTLCFHQIASYNDVNKMHAQNHSLDAQQGAMSDAPCIVIIINIMIL